MTTLEEQIATMPMLYGLEAHYRPGTSDEDALDEVFMRRAYRLSSLEFDVERGERWLDLGANIGAFALYCRWRDAIAECYEPDPDCFALLRRNAADFDCHNVAVTDRPGGMLPFWKSRNDMNQWRATTIPTEGYRRHPRSMLPNQHGAFLLGRQYDGVKIDIEGAEGGLLDAGFLPECGKLVLEYHTSRDSSIVNLERRLQFLRSRFRTVYYPSELNRFIKQGVLPKMDCLIHCVRTNGHSADAGKI